MPALSIAMYVVCVLDVPAFHLCTKPRFCGNMNDSAVNVIRLGDSEVGDKKMIRMQAMVSCHVF